MAQTYDDIADWYAGWVEDAQDDPFFPTIDALLGDVTGQKICDLACGEGRVARLLAARGASVLGVDNSVKLLNLGRAREQSQPLSIAYVEDDAQQLKMIPSGSFDGVVCNMALMDIPNLGSTLKAVSRVLRPESWFAFSILHPCFNTPASLDEPGSDGGPARLVRGYWDEGFWRSESRPGPPGKVGSYHRTLSTYVNELTAAGLVIEHVEEPRATPRLARTRPIWTEVPASIVALCRKRSGSSSPVSLEP